MAGVQEAKNGVQEDGVQEDVSGKNCVSEDSEAFACTLQETAPRQKAKDAAEKRCAHTSVPALPVGCCSGGLTLLHSGG
jgi:hypothetical protein